MFMHIKVKSHEYSIYGGKSNWYRTKCILQTAIFIILIVDGFD